MNKIEMIAKVKEVSNEIAENKFTKKDIEHVIESLSQVITETLADGDSISIPNIAKFTVTDVAERSGVSAINEKAWTKPAHRAPKCKIATALKNAVQ